MTWAVDSAEASVPGISLKVPSVFYTPARKVRAASTAAFTWAFS